MKSVDSNHKKPTILLVDDDEQVRFSVQVFLEFEGFWVEAAASGFAAVEHYKDHGNEIDLVLLDVSMPDLDGPQTIKLLKKIDPNVRCCFMTGSLGNHSLEDYIRMGSSHVFLKPFPSLTEMASRLRQLIETDQI